MTRARTVGYFAFRMIMALVSTLSLHSAVWAASSFPEKGRTIRIVVPYSSGGPADKTARDLAQAMQTVLGVRVVVENVAGENGTVGATKVIQAAPDGYTLLFSHIGMSTAYALYRKSADTLSDFEYVGVTSELPMFLIGRLSLEPSNVAELMAWVAKRRYVSIANAGTGSASHMCSLLVQEHLKVRLKAVPYKGTAPAMNDIVAGHVDLLCDQSSTAGPQIVGGRVKPFGVTTPQRFTQGSALGNVPTLDEAGLKGFNLSVWQGLYAPKGTPKQVITSLNLALRAAVQDPEFAKKQALDGARIVKDEKLSPEGHRNLVQTETAKWSEAIRKANAYAD